MHGKYCERCALEWKSEIFKSKNAAKLSALILGLFLFMKDTKNWPKSLYESLDKETQSCNVGVKCVTVLEK